ncbi:MAG: hypothetical protein GWP07_05765 [Xanthomonadaceae bacterium]|nr:hypothetical protein [Xanthomonadaceae bacterium]
MFRHGSRSFSPAVHGRLPRRPPRITIQVIRPASGGQNRYEPSPNILLMFLAMQVRKLSANYQSFLVANTFLFMGGGFLDSNRAIC